MPAQAHTATPSALPKALVLSLAGHALVLAMVLLAYVGHAVDTVAPRSLLLVRLTPAAPLKAPNTVTTAPPGRPRTMPQARDSALAVVAQQSAPMPTPPVMQAAPSAVLPAALPAAVQPAPGVADAAIAPVSASVAAASDYVPASADAAYLNNHRPDYPLLAYKNNYEGTVSVAVRVSSQGLPLTVSLYKSSRFGCLDEAAVAAVHGWRFVPARRGGVAVEDDLVVPVVFKLDQG